MLSSRTLLYATLAVILLAIVGGVGMFYYDQSGSLDRILEHQQQREESRHQLLVITERDHIWGNINAPIKMIEYSDSDCPFCRNLLSTLAQVQNDYQGDVVWVYRHSQLPIYPYSIQEAEAMECAASLGGESVFFDYRDQMYEIKLTGDGAVDIETLVGVSARFDLDENDFRSCLLENRFLAHVNTQRFDGAAAGVGRVPHTFIISPDGNTFEVVGNKPYAVYSQLIEVVLARE